MLTKAPCERNTDEDLNFELKELLERLVHERKTLTRDIALLRRHLAKLARKGHIA